MSEHGCDIKTISLPLDKNLVQSMNIRFDNTYARLPERFFARQESARVPSLVWPMRFTPNLPLLSGLGDVERR